MFLWDAPGHLTAAFLRSVFLLRPRSPLPGLAKTIRQSGFVGKNKMRNKLPQLREWSRRLIEMLCNGPDRMFT